MSIQFSNIIKEFLRLDEEIRSLSKAKTERTKQRDRISKEISSYYKQNNIHSLNVNHAGFNQQLELVEKSRLPSVNQKFLREALSKYCNNDKIVDNMIEHILEEREQNSSSSFKLKRIIPNSKKSKVDASNAMALIKENEKNKIQERFEKLAEYAIAKGTVMPTKILINDISKTKEQKQNPIIEKDIPRMDSFKNIETEKDKTKINFEKENNGQSITISKEIEKSRVRTISIGKEVKEEQIEYYEESEYTETETETETNYAESEYESGDEEVDLDDIPMEETGYKETPPQLDIPMEKNKTIRNIITQKLDDNNIIDKGSIPQLQNQTINININKPQQIEKQLHECEKLGLESFESIKKYFEKYPLLQKWTTIQYEKIKLLKNRNQFDQIKYKEIVSSILTHEKQVLYQIQNYKLDDTIKKIQVNIINYVQYRSKN